MNSLEGSAESSSTKILCCWCNNPSPNANHCKKCSKPCHSVPPCSFAIDDEGNGATVTCFNCWLIFENAVDSNAIKPNEYDAKGHDNSMMAQFADNLLNVREDNSAPKLEKNPRKRRVFTIKEKLDILEFAKNSSVHAASRQFNVDRSSIQDWKRQETELRQMESEKRKRLMGGGRKVCDPKFDETLSNWVRELRAQKVRVTRNMIVAQAQQLSTNYKSMNNFTASNGWLERFMQRHNFSLRTPTGTFETEPSKANGGQMDAGSDPSIGIFDAHF
ncbi:hypothetical protein niasHS_015951 [Heterodera schachtii]|uniref:HTH CENPB-type domain-containing protein n=2 Tax=Heterodera TaxID=34509 RepID=A0ABD2HT75_HETSC